MDEGYIKFKCNWIKSKPFKSSKIQKMEEIRKTLYQIGVIGAYENGIGYGNISARVNGNEFFITGSATGNLLTLDDEHFSKVTGFNLDENTLNCVGPIIASSESMTHGVIYHLDKGINAVVHVHNKRLWLELMNRVPTTSENVGYGTPQMAREIMRLFKEEELKEKKIIVMAGHEDGVIVFGKDLEEAGKVILSYLE